MLETFCFIQTQLSYIVHGQHRTGLVTLQSKLHAFSRMVGSCVIINTNIYNLWSDVLLLFVSSHLLNAHTTSVEQFP